MYFAMYKQLGSVLLVGITLLVLLLACTTAPTVEMGQDSTTSLPTETAALPAQPLTTTATGALATPASAQSPTAQPNPAVFDVAPTDVQYLQTLVDVNIRSGPSTDDDVIGTVFAGQAILVTGIMPDTSWWRVICPDDSVGNCFVINDANLVQPANAPGADSTPLAGETTTYRDERAGFAFDYPAVWMLDGNPQTGARSYIMQLTSWTHAPGENPEETPLRGARLDVSVLDWDPKYNLAAYRDIRMQAWTASGMSIVSEESQMLSGDHPAIRFLILSPGSTETSFVLLTTVGDRYLTLSGFGNIQALNAIAQTLEIQQ